MWPLERHSLDEWAFVRGEGDEMEFGETHTTSCIASSDLCGIDRDPAVPLFLSLPHCIGEASV